MRWRSILVAGGVALAGCGQFGASADGADLATGIAGQGGATGRGVGDNSAGAGGDFGATGGNVLRLGATKVCAAAAGSSSAANYNVVLSSCAAATPQLWTFDGGRLSLSDGRCLMAPASPRVATQAVVLSCDKVGARQGRWQFEGAQLTLVADTSRCLQAGGQASGSAVGVVACDAGDTAQQWALQNAGEWPSGTATQDANAPREASDPSQANDANHAGNPNDPGVGGNPNGGAGAEQPSGKGRALDVNVTTKDVSNVGGSPRGYSGPAVNFPNDPTRWDSWDNAWARASRSFPSSNTAAQNGWIRDAVVGEASTTGMDARFILAVIMQESGGDVHVRTTNNGVRNPGLMQSHNGATFADLGDGGRASIFQMVQDGVEGTRDGDGLLQGVQKTKNYFAAGRLYNSGQLDANNLSNGLGATASYCQDLANRVMGRL